MPLVLNGTTGVQDNSGAFVQGTAVNSTSGTSFTFGSIPSWVKRVTVLFAGVSQTDGGVNPYRIQLGTSGGIVTTGYVGAQGYVGGGPAATSMSAAFEIYHDTPSNLYGGMLTVTNISGNTWVGSGVFGQTQAYTIQIGGSVPLGGALTQIRVTTASGTSAFDAGIINILYE
jgi:hypothetical protein